MQSAKLARKRRGHRALRLTGMIWSAAVPSGFPERTGDAEPVRDERGAVGTGALSE